MPEITLAYVEFSERHLFTVRIADDADVYDLKAAIHELERYNVRYLFPPSALTLYMARKKEGEEMKWLKYYHKDKENFFKRGMDPEYEEMSMMWKLSDTECFGENFESPGRHLIHVIVELPILVADPQWNEQRDAIVGQLLQDAPSSTSASGSDDFKEDVCSTYKCNLGNGMLRCMLLDMALPAAVVTAVHIFRQCDEDLVEQMMGLSDIDDVKNGLMLFKPFVQAFNNSQITFIYDRSTDTHKLKIFDRSLKDQRLIEILDPKHLTILLHDDTASCESNSQEPQFAPDTSFNL